MQCEALTRALAAASFLPTTFGTTHCGGVTFWLKVAVTLLALFIVMLFALPWVSPGSFALEPFRETFNYLMVVCMALFGYLHVLMLQAALHPEVDMARLLMTGLLLFFVLMGNVLGKLRRNFWVGVRTPWTLASDKVWIATHRLAARLMVVAGMIGLLGASWVR